MKKMWKASDILDFKLLEKRLGKKIDEEDFIVPAIVDSPFKFLFGTEANKDLLADFLKAILHLEEEGFHDISFKNVEMQSDFLDDKKVFLDVRVSLESGEEINIEIQRLKKKDLQARFLYYWSRMFVNQAKIGWKYKDLKKCISIFILDFKLTEEEDCHKTYHLYEDKTEKMFSDLLELHLIELPNVEMIRVENQALYDWLKFIKTSSRKEMKQMSEMNPKLKKAMERMFDYSLDEDSQLLAIKEYNKLLDELTLEEDAREFGREEGRTESMFLVAKNLKDRNSDISFIMDVTGLTKEQVENL